jgi:hypothetical protein
MDGQASGAKCFDDAFAEAAVDEELGRLFGSSGHRRRLSDATLLWKVFRPPLG